MNFWQTVSWQNHECDIVLSLFEYKGHYARISSSREFGCREYFHIQPSKSFPPHFPHIYSCTHCSLEPTTNRRAENSPDTIITFLAPMNFTECSTSHSMPRGSCNPHSRLETRRFKTRHFEKPRFPCFELQKLD